MKVNGIVVLTGATLADGRVISTQEVVDRGLVIPAPGRQPSGWGLQRHEVPLGKNLFTDVGRQQLAYCLGFKSPAGDYAIASFGVGTGTAVPRVTDTALEAPISFYDPGSGAVDKKPVDTIDFPTAFVIRVSYSLAAGEANGYLLTELGLFTGNGSLVARKTNTGISKDSSWSPSLSWLLRL